MVAAAAAVRSDTLGGGWLGRFMMMDEMEG